MAAYVRQVECMSCSNTRSFIHYHADGQRAVGQAEALALGKRALLACGRCGSASLLLSWNESIPDAPAGIGHEGGRTRTRAAAKDRLQAQH